MKIIGDARKLIDTFIQYATQEDNRELADALYYDEQALRVRAEALKEQLEADDD